MSAVGGAGIAFPASQSILSLIAASLSPMISVTYCSFSSPLRERFPLQLFETIPRSLS